MQKIALIDNYDSFTFNLVHYLEYSGLCKVDVFRNDVVVINELKKYDALVLSPGPGLPKQAGKLMEVIDVFHSSKKMLGVCLGHQAIAEYFGATLYNLNKVFHGVATEIAVLNSDELFVNLPSKIKVGRYHSWAVSNNKLSSELEVTASDETDIIMALSHQKFNVKSVQFHPESILTEQGLQIINNWIAL